MILARAEQPALIFMDIQLPGMDGREATQVLKADTKTRHIPIVALTAFAMKGDRERLLAEGFDGYVSKPINKRNSSGGRTVSQRAARHRVLGTRRFPYSHRHSQGRDG